METRENLKSAGWWIPRHGVSGCVFPLEHWVTAYGTLFIIGAVAIYTRIIALPTYLVGVPAHHCVRGRTETDGAVGGHLVDGVLFFHLSAEFGYRGTESHIENQIFTLPYDASIILPRMVYTIPSVKID